MPRGTLTTDLSICISAGQAPQFLKKEKYRQTLMIQAGKTLGIQYNTGSAVPTFSWKLHDENRGHPVQVTTDDVNGIIKMTAESPTMLHYTLTLHNYDGQDQLDIRIVTFGKIPAAEIDQGLLSGCFVYLLSCLSIHLGVHPSNSSKSL